jgi:thioredoxin-like negative regulator of GroEL
MTNAQAGLWRGFPPAPTFAKIPLSWRKGPVCGRPQWALTTVKIATAGIRSSGKSLFPAKFAHMNRREKLEELLRESPDDVFLRYALALAWASEGNAQLARERLEALLDDDSHYVPAYLQLAQLQVEVGATVEAKSVLARGIEMARRAGNSHAEGEMRGLLEQLP